MKTIDPTVYAHTPKNFRILTPLDEYVVLPPPAVKDFTKNNTLITYSNNKFTSKIIIETTEDCIDKVYELLKDTLPMNITLLVRNAPTYYESNLNTSDS